MNLTIDPNGLWRRQRFEFCNALEAALDEGTTDEQRIDAWVTLTWLGVTKSRVDEAVKTAESRDFPAEVR